MTVELEKFEKKDWILALLEFEGGEFRFKLKKFRRKKLEKNWKRVIVWIVVVKEEIDCYLKNIIIDIL